MKTGTTPLDSLKTLPVQRLTVTVVEGPDAAEGATATGDRITVGTAEGNTLVLTDPTVSRYHLELRPSDRGVRVRDLESTNGVFASGALLESGYVRPGTVLRLGRTKVRVDDADHGTVEIYEGQELAGILGRSPAMRQLMAQVVKIARAPVSVLLVGESGTGKEVVASALHRLSPRNAGPYEIVDCASLAPNLVASELFGHERGAFTGADRQRQGAFERAHHGTLFLDEVGELPPELQPNLLGALERRRIRRVGGQTELPVDVRVVSATHRDLRAEVNSNAFRLDLYYRLAVVTLEVPPLRERREDIPLLAEHFAHELGFEGGFDALFGPEERQALMRHRWPGNVRELRNLVEATVALGEAPTAFRSAAPEPSGDASAGIEVASLLDEPYKRARRGVVEQFEARYLPRLLERAGGNVSEAARLARMDRSYLFSLLRKHGLR